MIGIIISKTEGIPGSVGLSERLRNAVLRANGTRSGPTGAAAEITADQKEELIFMDGGDTISNPHPTYTAGTDAARLQSLLLFHFW